MISVRRKKPEKPSVPKQKHPINHPQISFKINRKFTIISAEKRRQYVENLDKWLKAFGCLAQTKAYLKWKSHLTISHHYFSLDAFWKKQGAEL